MSRAVYIGGFGNGRSCAERVAEALSPAYYEEIDAFTFSDSIKAPEKIRRAVSNVDVFTHSAGMLALEGTAPDAIHAFNPPMPTSRSRLFGRTIAKTYHMHKQGRGILTGEDKKVVRQFDRSAAAEAAAHPLANAKPFLNGEISRFNAIEFAKGAVNSFIPTSLIYTFNDDYFQPSDADYKYATDMAVRTVQLPGEHDELVLRPVSTIGDYFEAKQSL